MNEPSQNFLRMSELLIACSDNREEVRGPAIALIQNQILESPMEIVSELLSFLQESPEVTSLQSRAAIYLRDAIKPNSPNQLSAIQTEWSYSMYNPLKNNFCQFLQVHIFNTDETYHNIIAQLYSLVFLIEQKNWGNGLSWIIEQLKNPELSPPQLICVVGIISEIFHLQPIGILLKDNDFHLIFKEIFMDIVSIIQREYSQMDESIFILHLNLLKVMGEMLEVQRDLICLNPKHDEMLSNIHLLFQIIANNFPISYLPLYQTCFKLMETLTKIFYDLLDEIFPDTEINMLQTILLYSQNSFSITNPEYLPPLFMFWHSIASFERLILLSQEEIDIFDQNNKQSMEEYQYNPSNINQLKKLKYQHLCEHFIQNAFPALFNFMIPSPNADPNEIENRYNPDISMWATLPMEEIFSVCPEIAFPLYSQVFLEQSGSEFWQVQHAATMIFECFSHIPSRLLSEVKDSNLFQFIQQYFPILIELIKKETQIPRLEETVVYTAAVIIKTFPRIIRGINDSDSQTKLRSILQIINLNPSVNPIIIKRYLSLLKFSANAYSSTWVYNPIIPMFQEIDQIINFILSLPQMEENPDLITSCFETRGKFYQCAKGKKEDDDEFQMKFLEQTLNAFFETPQDFPDS